MTIETLWAKLQDAFPDVQAYWVTPFRDMSVRVPYADALGVRAVLEKTLELTSESCGSVTATSSKGGVLVLVESIPAQVGAVALAEHVAAGGECTPQALGAAWEKAATSMRIGETPEPSSPHVRLLAEMLTERVESAGGDGIVTMAWLDLAGAELRAEPSIAEASRILTADRQVRVERPQARAEAPHR